MTGTADIPQTLEQKLQMAGGPVELLRGPGQLGPYVFPGIPAEFTNWRDEVRAWKDEVALLEQSYHMSELHLRGTDIVPFLSTIAVNRFDPFPVRKAKQIVLASHDGYLVGDAILFHEEADFLRVVGAPFALNWVKYHAENSGHGVTAELDHNWSVVEAPRDVFRFQVQGPRALELVTEVVEGPLPEVGFFSVGDVRIAGKDIRALRHGMAGTPGFELYGPWADQEAVREAFQAAGEKYGLRKVGALAYATTAQESGWLPLPLPAIYHGERMRPYREWVSAFSLEAFGSLGGSLSCDRIENYYVDPIEAGYERLVDWDRDFLGRGALVERAENQRRTKVTLVWNDEDVAAAINSALFDPKLPAQFIALPSPMYSTWAADAVQSGGETIGFSQYMSFSANAGHVLSHGIISQELAEPGTELTLLWGEPGSKRDNVGRNQLREIRATVAPTPYFAKVIKTANR
ncbi:aminomethyltransferase family protein [Modestobacter roseus]|uniref:Glycine cleavage system aminomethyltransferase T n=1 Tax=Modestobacter roseus TaxID=1181884 RepID=A0A562INW1_9ACTN|nr:aminomethyltransferase family protein [Modestobacter roseus]MQA34382.1 aminomethyl transferase family protein [Modestobacter roseus]TWH72709.1 glycine cleavage system aminomethyltransferase T [Modestobacter roseus]